MFDKSFHFSWLVTTDQWDWAEARNYCRKFCMDSVTVRTVQERKWLEDVLRFDNVDFIWTGGRKCNFPGCERSDLQPAIVNGWYWAPTGQRILPPRRCGYCGWSASGGLGDRQPDNRELRQGGKDEGCIAVLNNFYEDGITWHDVECSHRKPVVCEEIPNLVAYAFKNETIRL